MRNYRELLPYLRPHLPGLLLAGLCMFASSAFNVAQLGTLVPVVDVILRGQTVVLPPGTPAFAADWVARFQGQPPLTQLVWVGVFLIVMFLLKNITVFFQTVLMNATALRFLRDIRSGLYRKYQQLSLQFFGGERTGELVSRVTYDVAVLQNAITEGMANLVYQAAQLLFLLGTLLWVSWKLTLFSLILFPLIGYPVVRIGKVLRKLGFAVQERMADLSAHLVQTLEGIRIIKAFTAEEQEARRFDHVNNEFTKANIRTVKRQEALGGLTEVIGVAGVMAFVAVGARAVFIEQTMTPGMLVLFMAAMVSLLPAFKKISKIYGIHQQALSAAKRVTGILGTPPSVPESAGGAALPRFEREIRFEGVGFHYPAVRVGEPERPVLTGIDLTVRAGEVVALVGSSGAGKTTLLNLLPRFYDPTAGRILLDGADLRTVSLDSLRRQVALVTQDPFLFHATIRENISFGSGAASEGKVAAAAQAANADPFIRRLPAGYDTVVGERGARLSGGGRQRVSIARAILKDAPILLLDEPTSQLDSESEALVQEALDRLMAGRTVFVISHRLSTIRSADRIIVLEGGRIAAEGTHDDLLKRSPLYRRLYELQVAL